jgi:hypothetical protein
MGPGGPIFVGAEEEENFLRNGKQPFINNEHTILKQFQAVRYEVYTAVRMMLFRVVGRCQRFVETSENIDISFKQV